MFQTELRGRSRRPAFRHFLSCSEARAWLLQGAIIVLYCAIYTLHTALYVAVVTDSPFDANSRGVILFLT